jgi:hypothetical protein
MAYQPVDRVPYFEEGLREETIEAWRRQGLAEDASPADLFPTDRREEIQPELDPLPELTDWPNTLKDLPELTRRLDHADSRRLPDDWAELAGNAAKRDYSLMLRVHRGFFLSMGVMSWDRFLGVVRLLYDDPAFVHATLNAQGEFAARLADRILSEVDVDAAIFSEPIGGNDRPLMSPKMYEEFVLASYRPLLEVLRRRGVGTVIFRTYANARVLIPNILKWGFDCLWACEVNVEAMDYRAIRREFGRDLRLIGGIDLDALRQGRDAIRREIKEKVPPLLAEGGYIPLADGRVREDVPYENYLYYRELLAEVTAGG